MAYKTEIQLLYFLYPSEQTELIEDITNIMDSVFDAAEDKIEEELYKKGLMTCNSYLEKIDYMRVNGNDSVQEYIKYLDETYGEQR